MGESIHTLVHLYVDATLRRHFNAELVLINDFVWDVIEFESNVFRSFEWSVEVEIADVCRHELCPFGGYDAVEE